MQLRGWAIQAVVGTLLATSMEAQAVDWPAYGRDLQGTRYLPADEITRENVKQLGDLRNEFDFTQDPLPPLILDPHPSPGQASIPGT